MSWLARRRDRRTSAVRLTHALERAIVNRLNGGPIRLRRRLSVQARHHPGRMNSLSTTPLIGALSFMMSGHVSADPGIEARLIQLVHKYSTDPVRLSVESPQDGKPTYFHPSFRASVGAVEEASVLCSEQGGVARSRGIFRDETTRLIQSLGCYRGEASLWYLDFDQRQFRFDVAKDGTGVVFDVWLSINRLMPADPPEGPVLHWIGTYDAVAVAGGRRYEPLESTQQIQARVGVRFGFSYSWRHAVPKFESLEYVWRPAGAEQVAESGARPAGEYRKALTRKNQVDCLDPYSCTLVYSFDSEDEMIPGVWRLSLVADGVPVMSKEFDVQVP
jgi:hypothetical protein